MPITIRDADDRDIDLLVELNRIAQDLHIAALPAYFKHPDHAAMSHSFSSKLHNPEIWIWIASMGDQPVGYAVAILRERPENAVCWARRCYEIDEIAVLPAHRKHGAARALVNRVLTEASRLGVRDVELTSWSFNADARAAFEALGFQPMTVRFQRASH